jgi:hypothetical protein
MGDSKTRSHVDIPVRGNVLSIYIYMFMHVSMCTQMAKL